MLPIVTAFRSYLQHLGYSKSSVQMLPHCVASFFVYHNLAAPEVATAEHITGFYAWLHTRPNERQGGTLSEQYIHHHIYSLRVFFNWLEGTGSLPLNPISGLVFRREEKKSREPLSAEAVQALFSAAATDRERALLHLLYSCGLRRTEAVMLNCGDIHHGARMLYVRRGKGSKRRAIPLTEKVSDALETYTLTGRKRAPAEERAFLLNNRQGRISGNTCNHLVRRLALRAGLERLVTPHYLRHSIATHLLGAGVAIEQVKDFLGHRYLEATQLYAKVYKEQLRNL